MLGSGYLRAQTVATYNFEDGTADGWGSFYGASTPVATTADAYAGSYSLLTTTASAGHGGPSISLNSVLLPGAQYTITGWVKLTSGESASNANFTIARSDPTCSGGTCYDTIGSYEVAVTDSGWAEIGGSYTVSTTETGVLLYAQLVGATSAVSFYLDDVIITETAPPPNGATIASYLFNGSTDGWFGFGNPTLTPSTSPLADPNSNTTSLLVSNRTAGYMGPALNLLGVNNVVAGATYQITAYVMLAAPDSSNPTVSLSTKTADCATSGSYGTIATSAALSSTAWTKVQGTFSFSNLPGPPTTLDLYLQSSSATDSFYVSDVTISELSPAPISPSEQDNTGITSTFEDGGLDGWGSRSGSSTVTNSTAAAHSGTHSLLTTGRIANWDGPSISVSEKMYVGSTYNLSVWVLLVPTDSSSHEINMSLQTTKSGTTSYPGVNGYPGTTVLADGNWHQISVMGYTMSSPYDTGQASLYLQTMPASGNDLVSFYIDDFQLTYVAPPTIQTTIPSIYQTYSSYFPIGAAVDQTDLSGAHAQLLAMHFDSMTPGNDLKWSSTEPTLGTYTYGNGDNLVAEAVCNNMKVRGQNLVWSTGAQTPSYAFGDGTNSPANQATVTANIQEHIQSEVQHFGNKVYAWDVINEPLDPSQPDCLVHGPFYRVLGKSYIDVALQAARQYAPTGTLLFINEYSTADPNRLACLVSVIEDLKNRGIPIDGVGHETHSAINYPSVSAVVNSINTIAEEFPGINQQITEMDISVYNAGDTTSNYGNSIPPSVLAEEGWLYAQYFDAFRQLSGKISGVTLWGMADDDTWLDSFPVSRTDYPLPFDMNLQAKPAYWGIVDPTQLPGYGLTFSASNHSGAGDTSMWTLTATNGSAGPAYATQINGLTLTQTSGAACTPVITPPSAYPVVLGDIPANGSASASFTINFTGCGTQAKFTMSAPWSSATYETGTFVASATSSSLTTNNPEATLISPTQGATLTGSIQTFMWNPVVGATGYTLYVGSTGIGSGNLLDTHTTGTTATATNLPTNGGTIYARLWTNYNGVWSYIDYTFTAASPDALISPTPGSTFTGNSVTFTWAPVAEAIGYTLYLGSTGVGSANLLDAHTTATTYTATNLPINGETIYARLWTNSNGVWSYNDYTFTAVSAATLTSPTQGATFTGASQTFTWSPIAGATGYTLYLGSTGVGSGNLLDAHTTAATITATNLPANGETIYARLWTNFNGDYAYKDYTFTAVSPAALSSPTQGSTFTSNSVTFTWTPIAGATGYVLYLGSTGVGSGNLFDAHTTAATITATNLPTNGETIYARLWTNVNGVYTYNDYTFTAQ
jgi:endo-1,4-beta-xylanase